MGFDYALVHLKYTIPPAIGLTLVYWPLFTRLDLFKILFLLVVSLVATIPWDSYLIRSRIWTYPPNAVIGPTLFSIPAEEVFFFIIQTYNTSLLYLLLNKPTFKPSYLVGTKARDTSGRHVLTKLRTGRFLGQLLLAITIFTGISLIRQGQEGTYMGLILAWAGPFALFLWSLAYQFLLQLPDINTTVPIVVPTIYLWIVDTKALKRGTWVIEPGTKLGFQIWDGLEIEEAMFFLVTNLLIVFGLVAFDNSQAVLETFPELFPKLPSWPSPVLQMRGLLTNPTAFDDDRISGIKEAVFRLQKKSRSFYLASSVFSGRLQIDLILLYSFCRVADDLVDNASNIAEARHWISQLSKFLDKAYDSPSARSVDDLVQSETFALDSIALDNTVNEFPALVRSALQLLPTRLMPPKPLYDLLSGFKTDLKFLASDFPINDEPDLEEYANQVAGTVAELCLELAFHHCPNGKNISIMQREFLIHAGGRMGVALQYVNIARDISTDAAIGRVYIPTSWLEEEGLTPQDVISNPTAWNIEILRTRLLDKAFEIYEEAKGALAELPAEVRAPMRVAVESYMEIGRVLREKGYSVKKGAPTVPKLRRIIVAWKALIAG